MNKVKKITTLSFTYVFFRLAYIERFSLQIQ